MKETKTSKEEKIEYLNNSIRNSLRLAFNFLIISAAIVVVLLLCFITLIIVETKFIYSENNDIIRSTLGSLCGLLCSLAFCISMVHVIRNKKKIDYQENKPIYIVLFLCASLLIIGSVMAVVYSVIYIVSGKLASLLGDVISLLVGVILEIYGLFLLVGAICLLLSCCNAVKKYKIEYADDIQKERIIKQQLAQQRAEEKQHEKDVNTVLALLSKVGNKFFVKYYFELKDWAEPDILDIIQEAYTEETKILRIRKAKEIFDKKLYELALQKIADPTNDAVDDETRQKASTLLEQIK